MAIKGINKRALGRQEIFVFKGARKGERTAGKDLESFFRISTENPNAKAVLTAFYGVPDRNGDFIVPEIDIYFCFDTPDENFHSSMRAYNASGNLLFECDRASISKKRVTTQDSKGQIFASLKDVCEPCPIADMDNLAYPCPNRCTKYGELVFYLKCLMDANFMIPARLVVHGYEDIVYLTERLDEFYEIYGSISNSPFPSFQTRHKIPFTLSRIKHQIRRPDIKSTQNSEGKTEYMRTGRSCKGYTYPVSLHLTDESWLAQFQQWQKLEHLKSMSQFQLPPSAIAAFLNGRTDVMDFIDVAFSATSSLSPANQAQATLPAASPVVAGIKFITQQEEEKNTDSNINEETWRKLRQVFAENGWGKDVLLFMLQEKYNYSKAGQILNSQVEELLSLAKNPECLEDWLEEFKKIENLGDFIMTINHPILKADYPYMHELENMVVSEPTCSFTKEEWQLLADAIYGSDVNINQLFLQKLLSQEEKIYLMNNNITLDDIGEGNVEWKIMDYIDANFIPKWNKSLGIKFWS